MKFEIYPLGTLCKRVTSGGTPKSTMQEYYGGDIPWLNTKEINFNRIYATERCISKLGLENSAAKWITPPAVIVAMYGATAGKVAVSFVPLTTNQACCNMEIQEDRADFRFIYYYLKWKYKELSSLANGGAQQNLNAQLIKEFPILTPNLATQRAIANVLWKIDDKIELNQKINENLERQAQTLFRKWFVDNPDAVEWQSGTFSDLIEKTISGDWGKDAPSGKNTKMVYCIRGADIPDVRTGNKGKMPTRYILPKNYTAKQLVSGDIVVEISGGSPTQSTGRAAAVSSALLARYDKGMVCTNFCKALKPMAGYSMYVYHYWQHLYDMGVFFSYENGTTGIKNLDITGFLETEPITIAPFELIERFNSVCQSVYAKIYSNGLENERLAGLRDTLLPKLMSGEIDLSNIQL